MRSREVDDILNWANLGFICILLRALRRMTILNLNKIQLQLFPSETNDIKPLKLIPICNGIDSLAN